MKYLLIEWEGQPSQYSVVTSSQIAKGELRSNPEALVGKTTGINWKRKQFNGKVLRISSLESELEALADEFAEKACEDGGELLDESAGAGPSKQVRNQRKRKSRNAKVIESVLQNIVSESRPENQNEVEVSTDGADIEVDTDQADVELPMIQPGIKLPMDEADVDVSNILYKDKYRRLKKKYKDLKIKFRDLQNLQENEGQMELVPASNVFVEKSRVQSIKLLSTQPTTLARNLFRLVFSNDELKGHSLTGRRCNANLTKEPLPPIDPRRRDAVVEFVLTEYGFNHRGSADKIVQNGRKRAKRDIIKSLSDFLREESRK